MPIAHFGPAQADVYIPAIIALTVGAAAIGAVLVFLPALRGGSGIAAKVVTGLVAAASVVVAIALLVPAQRSLIAQVPAVQSQIASRYGLRLPTGIVSSLIDGSTVDSARIAPYTHVAASVKLVDDGTGGYELVSTPTSTASPSPLPTRTP